MKSWLDCNFRPAYINAVKESQNWNGKPSHDHWIDRAWVRRCGQTLATVVLHGSWRVARGARGSWRLLARAAPFRGYHPQPPCLTRASSFLCVHMCAHARVCGWAGGWWGGVWGGGGLACALPARSWVVPPPPPPPPPPTPTTTPPALHAFSDFSPPAD